MATGGQPINNPTATGASARVVTNAGVDSGAEQQIVTLADSAGTLLGTNAVPLPVIVTATGGQSTTAGTISATAANTPGTGVTASTSAQVVLNVSSAGNATFAVVTSAFVGTLIFETALDAGLNYAPIMAIREDGTGAESAIAISTASIYIRQWTIAAPGFVYFRVRCSAFTSGTAAVIIAPGPSLIEPNPSLSGGSQNVGAVAPWQSIPVTTSITPAATSTSVLAANANRRGVTIRNTSTVDFIVNRSGSAVTATNAGLWVPSGGYFENPPGYISTAQWFGAGAVGSTLTAGTGSVIIEEY